MRAWLLFVCVAVGCATAELPTDEDAATPNDATSNDVATQDAKTTNDAKAGDATTTNDGGIEAATEAACVTDGSVQFSANGTTQTGTAQTWQVPSGVCNVTIDARGAQGGGATGGKGAEMRGVAHSR